MRSKPDNLLASYAPPTQIALAPIQLGPVMAYAQSDT